MQKQTNIVNASNMYAFTSLLASTVFEAMHVGMVNLCIAKIGWSAVKQ